MRIIGGEFRRRRFDLPKKIAARPTTDFAREGLFNILDNKLVYEDESILDLFSGTGAISFEFLSRGVLQASCVEKNRIHTAFIEEVAEKLQVNDRLRIVCGDVFKFLSTNKSSFSVIFADPPYDHPDFARIPDIVLSSSSLASGGLFIFEHSRKHTFSEHSDFVEHRNYGNVNFSFFRKR